MTHLPWTVEFLLFGTDYIRHLQILVLCFVKCVVEGTLSIGTDRQTKVENSYTPTSSNSCTLIMCYFPNMTKN